MIQYINKAYIHNISTKGLRNIGDINLQLDPEKKRHLLITGNNGVGKSTFVEALKQSLTYEVRNDYSLPNNTFKHIIKDLPENADNDQYKLEVEKRKNFIEETIRRYINRCKVIPDNLSTCEFTALYSIEKFLVLYYPAQRLQNFRTPEGPKKLPKTSVSEEFIQVMVNLKTQAAYANLEGNQGKVDSINAWFKRFEKSLAVLLGHNDFKLNFISNDYDFVIEERGKEPYHFTELSDGYSAILSMLADIMLHMTTGATEVYDRPGIVIIDELETHLHVELQGKILPFLTMLFPNIQFVVTTHSPFVLSSIDDAVIFDMNTLTRYEDFSQYSYSNIIEGYFNASSYSNSVLSRLKKASDYLSKNENTPEEKQYILDFDKDLQKIQSRTIPYELINRWSEVKLRNFDKFNGILR